MTRSPKRDINTILGFLMFVAVFYTFIDPLFCKAGCGNLLEPVFAFLHAMLGAWGPRILFVLGGLFFFWIAADDRG